jgi:hypothetical protein
MATTPPKDEDKDENPQSKIQNPKSVEVLAFRYTREVAAAASTRLEELDTLLWFKELDDWQQARVRQVLAAEALSSEDQLTYTLAALLTGMELYIESLQQLPEPVA